MNKQMLNSLIVVMALSAVTAEARPMKVFILAGQSNMQGQARVRTIERLNMTEDSKQMYKDMKVTNGLPSAVPGVYGVYFTGGDKKKGRDRKIYEYKGPQKPGYSEGTTPNTSFGPEYTFAIYMQKHLNEPFLIIKTAWGGRDLRGQFRPPSAGEFEKDTDRHGNPIGYYYNLIVKRVNEVLADPGKYHPNYNKSAGYEIAGFVWFQGFNDKIQRYPRSEYGRLMACFIRDIRKDMKAPKMPFVIGVMGIGGVNANDSFRKAQAAPAELPEFKGNVAAVWTGQYWDMELVRIQKKGGGGGKRGKKEEPKGLTPDEQKLLKVGQSNAGYHYMGSAYIYGRIGKAFADSMFEMMGGIVAERRAPRSDAKNQRATTERRGQESADRPSSVRRPPAKPQTKPADAEAARLFRVARQAERMGQRSAAISIYTKIANDYKGTAAATNAAQRLKSLGR